MTIHIDTYCGHVVVAHQDNVREWYGTLAALVDCGETVSMHDKHLGPWTTQEAREVAAALIGWASRKDREMRERAAQASLLEPSEVSSG